MIIVTVTVCLADGTEHRVELETSGLLEAKELITNAGDLAKIIIDRHRKATWEA